MHTLNTSLNTSAKTSLNTSAKTSLNTSAKTARLSPLAVALGLALLGGLGLAAAPAGAQTVGNSGFETPNLDSGPDAYRYSDDIAGQGAPIFSDSENAQTVWAFSGNSGISGNGTKFTSGNPNAPEGTQVAFLQNTGSFSQTISGFTDGIYSFSFEAAQRGNFGDAQDFMVSLDGTSIGSFAPESFAYEAMTTDSVAVTAGSHTLTFTGMNEMDDHTAFIDAVSVSAAPAAVPEASTTVSLGLLLAFGMGGLVVAAKRKKSVGG